MSDYLKATPDRNNVTGGRKFFTKPIIDRIQEMGRTGRPDFRIGRLTDFSPRFDSPPYPVSDMLLVEAHGASNVAVNTEFRLGGKTYSAPIIFGEYSYGATHENVHVAVASAAMNHNFIFGVGEGGVAPSISENPNLMVQVATGLFGVSAEMLRKAAIVSVKMSQSAKTGIGGHLPKDKAEMVHLLRGMPPGVDILSDASRVFSIEEMRALVGAVKEVTGKPVLIKVGASHSFEAVAAGTMRSGADGIIIDGLGGGTGAAPATHLSHIGMLVEHAVVLADRQRNELGAHGFRIIAAGRVDTPEKALKLVLLGADAVMLGTASLIALGCKVVNMCHKACPAALTGIRKLQGGGMERLLDVEWGIGALGRFYSSFAAELGLALSACGFSTMAQARGRRDLLRAVNMPDSLAKALGVRAVKTGQTHPVPGNALQDYYQRHLEQLAETGRPVITSMGRTTDLDPPFSNLDRITHEGRTVVGPAYDAHRETIETNVRLPGGVIIGMPIILEGNWSDAGKLALEMNTIAAGKDGTGEPGHSLIPINPDSITENMYRIRESAGVVLDREDVSMDAIRRLWLVSSKTPVYAPAKADGNIREEAVRLARLGVRGIIIEGGLSMKSRVPIDVAVSQAHDALSSVINDQTGNILRNEVRIIARTGIRNPRDVYALICLGADVVLCDSSNLITKPTYARQLNLLRGIMAELRMLMGASGLSMMSSVTGNRGILRADHYLPEETAALLGVGYIGT